MSGGAGVVQDARPERSSGTVDHAPRCPAPPMGCGRMLAYVVGRPWRIQCSRCRKVWSSEDLDALRRNGHPR